MNIEKMKLLTAHLALVTLLWGCKKEGTIEIIGYDKPSGYYLYVGNWSGDEIYVVDTDSNVVVDTLKGFTYDIWDLTLTASGKKLYVTTKKGPVNAPGEVYSVDLKSHEVRLILDKASDVYLSPRGDVLIFSQEPYKELQYLGIIDTFSDKITYLDTLRVRNTGYNYQSIVFDKNRSIFYGINTEQKLFAYDYCQKRIIRVYNNFFGSYKLHMMISMDNNFLYVAGGPVFDLEYDSVVAGVGGNYLGSLALSPNGEYLYITDPGKYLLPEPVPTGKVYIYQIGTYSYIGELDVNKVSAQYQESNATDHIILMPDGKTAYVTNWITLLFVMDLQNREVKKVIKFGPTQTQLVSMAIGLKLR